MNSQVSTYIFTGVSLTLAALILTDAVAHAYALVVEPSAPVAHHVMMVPVLIAFGVTCVSTAKSMFEENLDKGE